MGGKTRRLGRTGLAVQAAWRPSFQGHESWGSVLPPSHTPPHPQIRLNTGLSGAYVGFVLARGCMSEGSIWALYTKNSAHPRTH